MKKLSILVFLAAALFLSLAHAQTEYGRIKTDRISNNQTIIITGATPDLSAGNVFKTNNGAPITITNFTGGVDSQVITVNCGETNTTIQNNSNIVTSTAADIACTVNKAQDFTYDAAQVKWVQKSGGSSGGGSNPLGNNGGVQSKNGSVLQATGLNDDGTRIKENRDHQSCGPNPWFDITCFGATVSNGTATNCGINAASTTLRCATNPDFKDASQLGTSLGHGIVIPKAGALPTIITPSTPTVMPNLLNGATTYNYKVIAEDYAGGLTAASPQGSTTTGPAALGETTITVTLAVATNGITTYTTSAAHNLQPGMSVILCQFAGSTGCNGGFFNPFSGAKTVNTTPTTTTFTTVDGSSLYDASEAPPSGQVKVMACNTLTFPATSFSGVGTLRYWIYRNNVLAGVAVGLDPFWVDCGDGAPAAPGYIPSAPPGAAQAGYLATTVVSGGLTNSMTLANAAGTTVSGQTATHDNSRAVLAAAAATVNQAGGAIYIPSVVNSAGTPVGWPFSATTNFQTIGTSNLNYITVLVGGLVSTSQPWIIRSNMKIEGVTKRNTSFFYMGGSQIQSSAQPVFYITSASVVLRNLQFTPFGPQATSIYTDNLTNGGGSVGLIFSNVAVGANFGSGRGRPMVMKGGFDFYFDNFVCDSVLNATVLPTPCLELTNSSTAVFNGISQIPGHLVMNHAFFAGSGISINAIPHGGASSAGTRFTFRDVLSESILTPFLRIGPMGFINDVLLEDVSDSDPIAGVGTPFVDASGGNLEDITIIGGQFGGTPPLLIGGGATVNLKAEHAGINLGNTPAFSIGVNDNRLVSKPFGALGSGRFTYMMAVPGPATGCVVSAGGTVPVGTFPYQLSAVDADLNETTVSASTYVTTTLGNQTVTCNFPARPAGSIGFNVFRNGARVNCPVPGYAGATFVDNTAACGQSPAKGNFAGSSILASTGLTANSYRTVGSNGLTVTRTNTATANRTQTEPDASGQYVLDSTFATTATTLLAPSFDNFNRANGGLGSNWTTSNGSALQISSNQVTTTNSNQGSFWNAVTFSSDQFSEIVVNPATLTFSFVAATVRHVTGGNSYSCLENFNSVQMFKMVAGNTNTSLGSFSTTPANGDLIRLEISGTSLSCYRNGVLVIGPVTDSSYATGQPGVTSSYDGTHVAALDSWSGGSLLNTVPQLNGEQYWPKVQHFDSGITLANSSALNSASGNSGRVAQSSGTLVNGNCGKFDVNLNLVDAGAPCGTVTPSTSDTLTNKTIDAEGTGNTITIPSKLFVRFAVCNNGTAALSTDTTAASTVGCFGTNTKLGVWQAADEDVVTFSVPLIADFTGNIDGRLFFNSPDTTGTAIFNVALACVDGAGATADDPAYNASSAFGTITLAAPANASWVATVSNITKSGTTTCAAGNWLNGKVTRATDTGASRVNVKGLELTVRRAM